MDISDNNNYQFGKLQVPEWFKNLQFLIVDDEEFNLFLLKNILKKWKIAFDEATDGLKAVEFAKKTNYDLILMDIRMPEMDGYKATELILKQFPEAKIVALTGSAKPNDIKKIEQAGMKSFLQKPYTESILLNLILRLIPKKLAGTPPKTISEVPVLSFDELEQMTGGDDLFFKEMLHIFIQSSENAVIKFHQLLETHNWGEISETAHKLAAPVKHLKATVLYSKLKQIENLIEVQNPEDFETRITDIEYEITKINTLLRQKLEENKSR